MSISSQENTSEFSILLSLNIGQITLQNEQIQEFYFIEDIFSFCVTGKITFYDKHGIFEFGPLTGNEQISIQYGIENNEEWVFNIYKISRVQSDVSPELGSKQTIELYFVDKMFFNLNFYNFSKSWKNKSITTIIKNIAEDILGVTKWDKEEASSDKLEYFYSPYWTSNKNIYYLLKYASGHESGEPGYIFYNNSQGSNLVTLDKLLKQKKLMTIDNNDDGLYIFEDENLFLFNKILSWKINGIDLSSLKTLTGNTSLGYNTKEKKFNIYENTYDDIIEKHTILGKYSLFNSKNNSSQIFSYDGFTKKKEIENKYKNKWIKEYDKQQLISITVRGHEARTCSEMIEIKWPSAESIENIFNINLSGKYLIKSITHYFSNNTPTYLQKMILIKNGYEDSNAVDLKKSIKKNIV